MLKQILSGAAVMAGTVSATGQGVPWTVEPNFKNKEASIQISGASCPTLASRQNWCIAINDEKKYIQLFERDRRRIKPGKRIRIMAKIDDAGKKLDEPDLEGIARDGGFVYLTGSHGAPRKGKKLQPSRFRVFRFPVDAKTGKPDFKVSRKKLKKAIVSTDGLKDAIARVPALRSHAGQALANNGVTIEGLGARDGQLFFGLRTPVDADGAFILEASAEALFSGSKFELTPHRVALGNGYGIRAIERFRDAFLLLAGTGYGAEMPPAVWLWAPGYAPKQVTILDVPQGWKAEAMVLIADKPGKRPRVLVFFDGQKNGAPIEFRLPLK